jgi:hypothetical protein
LYQKKKLGHLHEIEKKINLFQKGEDFTRFDGNIIITGKLKKNKSLPPRTHFWDKNG